MKSGRGSADGFGPAQTSSSEHARSLRSKAERTAAECIRRLARSNVAMPPESSRARSYLLPSLLAGVATTALLWRADVGLSWLVVVIVYVAGVLGWHRETSTYLARLWGGAAIWLALCMCWRASTWTMVIAYPASIAMILTLPLLVHRRLRCRDLGDLPALALTWIGAAFPACADARRSLQPRDDRKIRRVIGGLLLGLPVSLTVGVLLSANPRFETAVADIIGSGSDIGAFASWALATTTAYLLGALALLQMNEQVFVALRHPALLGRVARTRSGTHESPYRSTDADEVMDGQPRTISTLTWSLVLSQLVLVFGVFVAVNLEDFFGGHALVRGEATLTYAAHLHAGFAEVMFATSLTAGVIMFGHAVVAVPAERRHKWSLAALEIVLLSLTVLTLASCWHRNTIYMEAYGYTHARLGVMFIQLGLLGALGLTSVRALFRRWTGQAAYLVALPVVLALSAVTFNADLFVARGNLRRLIDAPQTATSTGLDVVYLSQLSADALPALEDEHVPEALALELRSVWRKRAAWLREGEWRGRRALGSALWGS